jgi:hypothetical protein
MARGRFDSYRHHVGQLNRGTEIVTGEAFGKMALMGRPRQ